MLYPTIKQYIDALRLAEDNFDQLANFRLVTEADGSPVMSSGNFAVVFKMQDTRDGSFLALKCFLKDQPGRAEAYRAIADELEQVVSPYLTRIQYLEGELFVGTSSGGAEYPVLVMDWVEGITLENYLRAHLSDPYALHLLAYQFGRLAAWLLTQPFAHGDLKPDNILVRPDGTLVLVDYDGMFVPAMQGQRAPEMGSPDFRHPDRTDADFSEHIDDFALASILLSLRAVAHCPDYLGRYGAADHLLLSEADYRSPEHCAFLRQEFPSTSAELDRVYALFLLALRQKTLAQVSFRLFNLAKPAAPPPPVVVNTANATKEEIASGIKDEYGVVYSPDGTELLECTNRNLVSYQVKEGCKVIRGGAFLSRTKLAAITLPTTLTHIGDSAFGGCLNLTAITLPAGLTHIGDSAFYGCKILSAITLPASLTHIGGRAFYNCWNLPAITLPDSLTYIGDWAFSSTGIRSVVSHSSHFLFQDGCLIDVQGKRLIAFLSDQAEVTLPAGLTHIGDGAFVDCRSLTAITLPASLTHIWDSAFSYCKNLSAITLPVGLTHIGDSAFYNCEKLTAITLPAGLTHIGNSAFEWCENLTAITLPASLAHIGNSAFEWCKNLTAITLPATLTHIGDSAFSGTGIRSVVNHSPHFAFQDGCLIDVQGKRLIAFLSDKEEVTLPAGLTHIGNGAFFGCKKLTAVTLPASLTHIGDEAFVGCRSLTAITLPADLMHIGDWAFMDCRSLTAVALPAGLTHIGIWAFYNCKNLTAITLPATLTHIGDRAFEWCVNLTDIHIPQGMTEHFKALLPSDLHSKLKELESLPKSPEGTLPENTNIFSKLKLYAAKPKLLEGAMSGLFTINANGDKVRFSQGNLQYQASTNIWRFAEHQWDYMGAANSKIGATNSGWIDLFGWGTGNNPKLSSENNSDYNTFVDWGVNAISGGGNAANLWRTLTREEWDYILNARADAAVKMATGLIDGVHGLILLPDIWAMPSECSFNARFAGWDSNQYTLSTWAKMEAAGAIFLPATGCRLGLSVVNVAKYGYYWSSTPYSYSKDCAYDMGFLGGRAACMYYSNPRCAGSSVRLVRDSN